jgi:outer membrane receptor for ferrienterochelin and colicins
MKKQFLYMVFFMLLAGAKAQLPSGDIYDMDFKALSKLKVVTVSKSEHSVDQTPSTIFVVPGSKIEERGYQTLDDVLADLPGFQFRNQINLNSYIFQRGIPNQNNLMLVLIDGIQVNELNSGGFYGGGQYNLSNIDRIEVVHGPASVSYGTNALSGVVNIITKSADNSSQDHIRTAIGNMGQFKSDLGISFLDQEKKRGLRISGLVRRTGLADLKGPKGDHNWTDLMENFEQDYALDIKAHSGGFVLGTNLMQKQSSTATLNKSLGTHFKDFGTLWNILFLNNYLKYSWTINPRIKGISTLYNRNATVLSNTIYSVLDTAQIGYYRPNNQMGFEQVFDYRPGSKLLLTSGVKVEYEKLSKGFSVTVSNSMEEKPPKPSKPDMQNNFLCSFFAEPQLTVFEKFYLSGGIRYDLSSVYGQVLTPKLGLNYAGKSFFGRLLYGEAFRAPKPWDFNDGAGNPDLRPERFRSFEGALWALPVNNIKLDAVFYFNKLENGFIKELFEEQYRWINHTEVKTLGLELSASYTSPKTEVGLNYTYNSSTDELGRQIAEISLHTANLLVSFNLGERASINLRTNFYGPRENTKVILATGNKELASYWILNGAFHFQVLSNLSVEINGSNLLNRTFYHPSNRTPDRYRQAQRMLMLGLKYSINR